MHGALTFNCHLMAIVVNLKGLQTVLNNKDF